MRSALLFQSPEFRSQHPYWASYIHLYPGGFNTSGLLEHLPLNARTCIQTDRYIHIQNLIKKNLFKKDREGMAVHTFNYSTQEAGASSRPGYFISKFQANWSHKTLSQNSQTERTAFPENLIGGMERRCRYLIKKKWTEKYHEKEDK